ncbi:nucleoporin p58/p45 [Eurytemora carolleeae]|uniref:nucleoporin p58/p45 n=1 Tax=Eurytemora carolleeae TaxID=1294199 RepID=UPI000C77E2E7|nr:nucleoporin p58/p45 [Eurytemora carolleeae]|eukprot:XP_023345421.1 nucleoporin p58/p45-like [Eurytemora affinis]
MEIAQRTKETPPSMQYENVAPMDYFLNLVTKFETDMTDYRKQIDETHQYLQTMGSGERVTSSDIVQAVHRLHSAFTDLAARYQCIHQTLARCKQQYISVHRLVNRYDSSNPS